MFKRILFILFISILNLQLTLTNKYCHISKSHTMCLHRSDLPSENCLDYKKVNLTFDNKTEILEAFNSLRNYVAAGGSINETDKKFPEASHMNMLQWKEELSQIAQRWADQCPIDENDKCRDIQDFHVGQIVFSLEIPSKEEIPQFAHTFTKIWYKGLENFTFVNLIDFDNSSSWLSKIFTQSVWGNAQYVGCGASIFKKLQQDEESSTRTLLVVCNIAPEGNILHGAVYKIGPPCSECPRKKCHFKFTNLCGGSEIGTIHTSKLFEHVARPWDWKSKLTEKRVYRRKIPGIWYNGECRCNHIYRSNGNFIVISQLLFYLCLLLSIEWH